VKKIIDGFNFDNLVYPEQATRDGEIAPPKTVFIPDVSIMRCIILANL